MPCLLDIPQDILTHHIGKYLSRKSRISLNQVLPIKHNIIFRFSKHFIDEHHREVIMLKFRSMFRRYDSSTEILKRNNVLYRVVQEIQRPINTILVNEDRFKERTVQKLSEFQDTLLNSSLSIKWYDMFQRQCRKSLEFVLSLS
jgi:hypothetical protein